MKFVFTILARLLPTKSVDDIVKSFDKFTDELAKAEARQNAKAAKKRAQAAVLVTQAKNSEFEAARAARVAANITNLTA